MPSSFTVHQFMSKTSHQLVNRMRDDIGVDSFDIYFDCELYDYGELILDAKLPKTTINKLASALNI